MSPNCQPHKNYCRRQIVRYHVITCRLLPDDRGSLAEAARDYLLDLSNNGRHSPRLSPNLLTQNFAFAVHSRRLNLTHAPRLRDRASRASAFLTALVNCCLPRVWPFCWAEVAERVIG